MHNLDIYNFIEKINKINIDNKSYRVVKNLISDLSNELDSDLIVDVVNIEKVNRQFFKMNKNTKICNDNFCTICQNTIKKGEHKTQLCDCNHIFHKKCLSKYLKLNKMNFDCPNCKKSYKKLLNKIAETSCDL